MPFSSPDKKTATEDVLSAREQEIIAWVAEGRTNIQIAGILAISAFTVKNHVQKIIRKLGASNRTEAAVRYRLAARAPEGNDQRGGARVAGQADA